ncbi:MAG: ABC transporter substrate-binding protein [Phenylobacterium sp.]|uniref:ABC transporter substrate-binding protein n=1 Tax=Phenylobacterium sp. TaxID=1871053 RepID=UPI0025CEC4FC|nr:ABC transporter substrate-binding protein [Phenylobacterium sp.]MBI1197661.1 ABC transporter substrate-binding protein [Phenylobacterium sp.]
MGDGPRIVSLLPSATEIAVALGFCDRLVGRSHECDFPAPVRALPALTRTKLEKGLPSAEIDRRVQEIVRQGLSAYEVDAVRLRELEPDVILTQTQCAICAVTPLDLEEALAAWTGAAPVLVSLAPDDLSDVWGDFAEVGAALGLSLEDVASRVRPLRHRLEDLARRTAGIPARPRVAAIEWIEPLMAAGNWIPELIALAGGESLFATPGQHSPWLAWDALTGADPDVIVLMPCGFQIPRTLTDLGPLARDPRWRALSAVREGRVFAADGHHLFNRPGPRLVESAEALAEILHPGAFDFGHAGRFWTRVGS